MQIYGKLWITEDVLVLGRNKSLQRYKISNNYKAQKMGKVYMGFLQWKAADT